MTETLPATSERRPWPPRFSDFSVGDSFKTYAKTVSEAHLDTFVGLAGIKFPVFNDDTFAAKETPFGGRIVPGFLTASLSAGMLETVLGPDVLAGLGLDGFRFHLPVRPGDTIHSVVTVENTRVTSDPSRGIVSLALAIINQRDETVLDYRATVMMLNRTE
jgi:acyl dehydratase